MPQLVDDHDAQIDDPRDGASSPNSEIIERLISIRSDMAAAESQFDDELQHVHSDQWDSARNLLHYVALRRQDVRPLQEQLVALGLSSLGRCESYVLDNVNKVLGILATIEHRQVPPTPADAINFERGRELIRAHTEALLGAAPSGRGIHIMVTMPSEAGNDFELVRDLLAAGMNCMRINCAHEDEETWSGMIDNLRRAETELGNTCRVMMDLGGPKIRTGPIEPGPTVVRWKPHRDAYGRTIAPARIWLTSETSTEAP
ncbi:MAG: pyruvate kinase, partial [Pirellulales bacterium]|nr:pyruvate kinase [Pirellulales bacterium]